MGNRGGRRTECFLVRHPVSHPRQSAIAVDPFEAGALGKSVASGAVVPYLLDLEFTEISGPLAQFQAKKAEKIPTLELVKAINNRGPQPLPLNRLDDLFELAWPRLESAFSAIPMATTDTKPVRSQRDVLEDLVEVIRTVERRTRILEASLTTAAPAQDWEQKTRALHEQCRQKD